MVSLFCNTLSESKFSNDAPQNGSEFLNFSTPIGPSTNWGKFAITAGSRISYDISYKISQTTSTSTFRNAAHWQRPLQSLLSIARPRKNFKQCSSASASDAASPARWENGSVHSAVNSTSGCIYKAFKKKSSVFLASRSHTRMKRSLIRPRTVFM